MIFRRRNKQGNDRVLRMTANGFTISSSHPTEEKTALMSNAALGCCVKLMCFAWREASIPNDISSLARLCGQTPAALQALWHQIRPCFAEDVFLPGRLVHDELEGLRATHKASHAARSAAGAIGAESRWRQSKVGGRAAAQGLCRCCAGGHCANQGGEVAANRRSVRGAS